MAKRNPSTIPRPSSRRFLRNLSVISRTPAPSSALLTILAGLVGSVHPFPVACHELHDPPSFLCPSLESIPEFDAQDFILPPQTPPPLSPTPGPSRVTHTDFPTPPPKRRLRRNVAPDYTQGDDGRWRMLSSWSLYGSTICVCRDGSSPTGNQPVDDLATTSTPSPTNELDLLPPGWIRSSEKSAIRTTLILSLSLVLVAVIVVFIIVFLLWRRKRKGELRKDVEKKLVKRKGPPQSVDSEKEHRTKSKLWARATTRWRENVRQSARRRRNARLSSTSLQAPNSSVFSLPRTISSTLSSPRSRSSSLPPSRPSSPTPTVLTAHPSLFSPATTDHEPRNVNTESPSPPPLPPAYRGRSHLSLDVSPVKDPAQLSPGGSLYDSHLSHVDSIHSDSPPPSPLVREATSSSFHAAHVATDDKAVLRRMEVLSSQPPTEPGSSDVCGSAPVLYEDDVQSLEYEDAPELAPSSVGFPLPPTVLSSSKGKAAALEYYDYDDLGVEPDLRPSAPPFEAETPFLPSAPPQGEAQPLPSAPPEIADGDDNPTDVVDVGLPGQTGGHLVDVARPGSPRPEPLPQYQP
ncbi:hypothetical protein BDM02DRAFT_54614 [Thelephora ganbajun]|uniref:Uncharacterized protein n=1 Tax=Thelephora ganbajun TaxID=370292 RepID=A0ACB6ZX53_THEGA|nr:hypothetical protein BDM02DRAFT_54614 [Thelephora ganbajun]